MAFFVGLHPKVGEIVSRTGVGKKTLRPATNSPLLFSVPSQKREAFIYRHLARFRKPDYARLVTSLKVSDRAGIRDSISREREFSPH